MTEETPDADATEATTEEETSDEQTPEERADDDSVGGRDADDERESAASEGDRHASEPGTASETDESGGAATDPETVEEVPEDLVERVRESDPEAVAREIAALRERATDAEESFDEADETAEQLRSKLSRTQADFQNYKKRVEKRREQERKRATEDLVERVVDVRDNLQRGLDQEGDIREGVESTLRQFDDVLSAENVEEIAPTPGDDVDPQRHEVLMRVASDRPEGTVAEVHRPGYEMAGKVIRPAQVTVSADVDQ